MGSSHVAYMCGVGGWGSHGLGAMICIGVCRVTEYRVKLAAGCKGGAGGSQAPGEFSQAEYRAKLAAGGIDEQAAKGPGGGSCVRMHAD